MTFDSLILIPVSVSGFPVVIVVSSPLSIVSCRLLNKSPLKIAPESIWYRRISVRFAPGGISSRIALNALLVGAVQLYEYDQMSV